MALSWVVDVIFITLSISATAIVIAATWYQSRQNKRLAERVRLTEEWVEKQPTNLPMGIALISILSAYLTFVLTFFLWQGVGWPLVNALVFSCILWGSILLLMWFQEVSSVPHIYHFKWKRVDEPFEYVIENVGGILKARGIPFERFDLEGYVKGGGNQKMRRHLYWSASKGPRYGVYELGMNEPIIQLKEVSGDDQDRTLISLYYLRERDDPLIDHLTHDIDRLLGLESL